jgi:hypothetical protein
LKFPETPDGKYFVSKGRLWRKTNPRLTEEERSKYVSELMKARRKVKSAKDQGDQESLQQARKEVNKAKIKLGERGDPWWTDGMKPVDRKHPKNTVYHKWWEALNKQEKQAGLS